MKERSSFASYLSLNEVKGWLIKMDSIRKFKTDEKGMAEFTEMVLHTLKLNPDDELEAVYSSGSLIVTKSGRFCFLCGGTDKLEELGNNKFACQKCLGAIGKSLKH